MLFSPCGCCSNMLHGARAMQVIPLCPSNAHVQAIPGVGSVNCCAFDLGGAFFNGSYCVLCVLSNTWGLRCTMFIFCVKEADRGMMACVAYSE